MGRTEQLAERRRLDAQLKARRERLGGAVTLIVARLGKVPPWFLIGAGASAGFVLGSLVGRFDKGRLLVWWQKLRVAARLVGIV